MKTRKNELGEAFPSPFFYIKSTINFNMEQTMN